MALGRADAALLDSYHEERHPVGADVVHQTTTLTNLGTAAGPEAAIRDVAYLCAAPLPRGEPARRAPGAGRRATV